MPVWLIGVVGLLFGPTSALATSCPQPPGGAITIVAADGITCVNTFPINSGTDAISLTTTGDFITLDNSGALNAGNNGIETQITEGQITITNTAPINAGDSGIVAGVNQPALARNTSVNGTVTNTTPFNGPGPALVQNLTTQITDEVLSGITIDNRGDLNAGAQGIDAAMGLSGTFNKAATFSISNTAAITGSLEQTVNVEETTTFGRTVDIDNARTINANNGISSTIANDAFTLNNTSSFSISNTGAVNAPADGRLIQAVTNPQANTLNNRMTIDNSGAIDAATQGIGGVVSSTGIAMNNSLGAGMSGGNVPVNAGSVTQSVEASQNNAVNNNLSIANTQAIGAGTSGIEATIQVTDGAAQTTLTNAASISLSGVNGPQTLQGAETQSVDLTQKNLVANVLAIDNSGALTAPTGGIDGVITNGGLALANALGIGMSGQSGIDPASAAAFSQQVEAAQENAIDNTMTLSNTAALSGVSAELAGVIENGGSAASGFSNSASISMSSSGAPLTLTGAFTQEVILDQTNRIGNSVSLDNSGMLGAGASVTIDNRQLAFTNASGIGMSSGGTGTTAGSSLQHVDNSQTNAIDNSVAVSNQGSIPPANEISVLVSNAGATGSGTPDFTNTLSISALRGPQSGIDAALSQLVEAAQTNRIGNAVDITNTQTGAASTAQIAATLSNSQLTFENTVGIGLSGAGPTFGVAAGSSQQAANLRQNNAVASEIAIDNSQTIGAGGLTSTIVNAGAVGNADADFSNIASVSISGGSGPETVGGAIDQSVNLEQLNSIDSRMQLTNSGPVDASIGLNGQIVNSNQTFSNSLGFGFSTGGGTAVHTGESLSQTATATQRNSFLNNVAVDNSGNLSGTDGVLASIVNAGAGAGADFANATSISMSAGAGSSSAFNGAVAQRADPTQTNRIDNRVGIANSGALTLTGTPIAGSIVNATLNFSNAMGIGMSISATPGTLNAGSVGQSVHAPQTNAIVSSMVIDNRGAINPGGISGVVGNIVNASIGGLTNTASISQSIGSGVATPGAVTQSIDLSQLNEITNQIGITNFAALQATSSGVNASIVNASASFTNSLGAGSSLSPTGGASGEQSFEFAQRNNLTSTSNVINNGSIDPTIGMTGSTTNAAITMSNNSSQSIAGPTTSTINGEFRQAGSLDQSNLLSNNVSLANNGAISASSVGIAASITNSGISLGNTAGLGVSSGTPSGATAVVQDFSISQSNLVDNVINVANVGTIDSGGDGISATIVNSGVTLTQSLSSSFSNAATAPSMTQAFLGESSNFVRDRVSIENSGTVNAVNNGITATVNTSASITQTLNTTASSTGSPLTRDVSNVVTAGIQSLIHIDNSGNVTGGVAGIAASMTRTTSISLSASQTCDNPAGIGGSGCGLDAQFASSGIIDIVNSGNVSGGAVGIVATNDSTSTTITNSGHIFATSNLAIDTNGASSLIVNQAGGVITGFVDLTDNEDRFDNLTGGVFETRGTSNFGLSNDVFENGGLVAVATDAAAGESAAFEQLETFNNSGGLISMLDGGTGDIFTISNTPGGTDLTYNASGNAGLSIDAFLATSGTADVLRIDGVTNGRTLVFVNNLNPIGSTPNFNGIPVVIVTGDGNTTEANFDLPEIYEAGFFAWDLVLDDTAVGSDQHELRTIGLSSAAFGFPYGMTALQELWHQSASIVADRQEELRAAAAEDEDALAQLRAAGVSQNEPLALANPADLTAALWSAGVAQWLDRDGDDVTITPPGGGAPVTFNLDSEQTIAGVFAGAEIRSVSPSPRRAVMAGLFGGYLDSDLDFDANTPDWHIEGPAVGGYASLMHERLYVDALVKADFLDIGINGASVNAQGASTRATNIGGRIDSGYRFDLDGRMFIEPQATLAYVGTDIDDVSIFGGGVSFDDGESLRGRAGLRIGTAFDTAYFRASPDLTVSVWNEFLADNRATIIAPTLAPFETSDTSAQGPLGEVSVGIGVAARSGFAGFLRGNVGFSDDVQSLGVRGGLRYAW